MLTSDSYYAANSAVTRPANGDYTVRHTAASLLTNLTITCPVPASDPGRGEGGVPPAAAGELGIPLSSQADEDQLR